MSVRGSARRLRRRWRERQTFASTALRSARRRRRPRSSSSQLISRCAPNPRVRRPRGTLTRRRLDAPDDPPSPVENVVPFINVPVYAESPEGTATSAHRRADARAPDSETFHRLRARALSLETVEASRSSPRRVPVLPVHRAQFQLPGRTNPFHVLAVKCEPNVRCPSAPDPNPHFAIAVDEEGHAYVSRVDDESFEAVCRFPGRVDETPPGRL